MEDPFKIHSAGVDDDPFGPAFGSASGTAVPHSTERGARRWLLFGLIALTLLGCLGFWIFRAGPKEHVLSVSSPPATASSVSPITTAVRPGDPATVGERAATAADDVRQMLANIPIVERLPQRPGYDRSCSPGGGCVFGPAWTDTEHAGCDTRSRVLGEQLVEVRFKEGTHNCKVVSGMLHDPYTGLEIPYGGEASARIQIDHVFALARAWDAGAADWSYDQRLEFANDKANLLAVSGKENESKSDSGPDTWMPPNRQFACDYSKIYLRVAAKYRLAITEADARAATASCLP